MEYLKEENKNLITLRTSIITVIMVLTGGIAGLFLSDTDLPIKLFFGILGIYFDILFLTNVLSFNEKIKKNIGEMKNDNR